MVAGKVAYLISLIPRLPSVVYLPSLQRWVLVCATVSFRATVISVCQAVRSGPSQRKAGQNTAGCENHQSR